MKLIVLGAAAALLLAPAAFAQSAPTGLYDQQQTTTTTVIFTDANGVQWRQTRSETWTLTYVQIAGTAPAVIPVPSPTPPPAPTPTPTPVPPAPPPSGTGAVITGCQSPTGQPVAQVAPGDVVVVVGTGFGAPAAGGNRVQVNGVIAVVKSWTNAAVTFIVPAVSGAANPVFLQLYAQPTNNWVLVASGTGPRMTPVPVPAPTPSP